MFFGSRYPSFWNISIKVPNLQNANMCAGNELLVISKQQTYYKSSQIIFRYFKNLEYFFNKNIVKVNNEKENFNL